MNYSGIHKYLNIDKRIKDIKKRIDYSRMEFEAQSYHGRTDFDYLGIFLRGFRVDTEVCNFVDSITLRKRSIQKYKRKKYYFNKFITTLDQHTYESLQRRYGNFWNLEHAQELGHDLKVLDEIMEIEEAIHHEFDTDPLPEHEKAMVGVELNDLKPDTLEDSFNTMLEKLGVNNDVTS